MPFSRGAIFGQQVGAGLQSGLNAALQEQMKQRQISQLAKKYGFDEEKIAGAMLGLPAVGGGASLNDQILYTALKSNPQFAGLQMPTKSIDPYAYYRKQPTQTQAQNEFPPIPDGIPSNNGIDAIIAADGKVGSKPYRVKIDSSWPSGTDEKGNVFYQGPDGTVYDANGEIINQ
jgi:hypothetical protein